MIQLLLPLPSDSWANYQAPIDYENLKTVTLPEWRVLEDEWCKHLPPNTPQPITVKIEHDFVSLLKQDVEITKFNIEDYEVMRNAVNLLNGLLRAGIIYGELEQIRDLIKECKSGLEKER